MDNMGSIIDSDIIIRSYFKKHQDKVHIRYAELKRIRYKAEPQLGVYIDVTYTSLRRVQLAHHGAVQMDKIQITIVKDELRQIQQSEESVYAKLEQYL